MRQLLFDFKCKLNINFSKKKKKLSFSREGFLSHSLLLTDCWWLAFHADFLEEKKVFRWFYLCKKKMSPKQLPCHQHQQQLNKAVGCCTVIIIPFISKESKMFGASESPGYMWSKYCFWKVFSLLLKSEYTFIVPKIFSRMEKSWFFKTKLTWRK